MDPEFKNSRKQQQLLARAFLKNLQNHRLQDALETMSSAGPCPTFSELRDAAVRMAHENKEKYGKYAPAPAQNSKGKGGPLARGLPAEEVVQQLATAPTRTTTGVSARQESLRDSSGGQEA